MKLLNDFTFTKFTAESNLTVIDGELTKVVVKETIYNLVDLCTEYVIATPDGKEIRTRNCELYESESTFRSGVKNCTTIDVTRVLNEANIKYDVNGNVITPYVYRFVDGEPQKDFVEITAVSKKQPIGINGEWYRSREECIAANDYVFVDENGVRHLRKSLLQYIKLSEKQKEVFQKLDSVLKEAGECGMKIVYLMEKERLGAFNDAENKISVDYYDGDDRYNIICDDEMEKHGLVTKSNFLWYMNCDDVLSFAD